MPGPMADCAKSTGAMLLAWSFAKAGFSSRFKALLGLTETKHHSNADLADLRLSDDMINVLKERRVDTALLGELVAHPDFMKLLADIQIYVEGVAAMQIQNLNAWVDVARAEIVEKYQPGENDRTTYLLQAAHVDEDEYFTSRVHHDIDVIMTDMRKAHQGRSDSAPESSTVRELKRDLEEVAQFNGSKLEQLIMLFCKQTKLRYNKLTEEEKQWLTRIAQKSELLKGSYRKEGKDKSSSKEKPVSFALRQAHRSPASFLNFI